MVLSSNSQVPAGGGRRCCRLGHAGAAGSRRSTAAKRCLLAGGRDGRPFPHTPTAADSLHPSHT